MVKKEKIKVRALPLFLERRFITLNWPDDYLPLFRKLKSGEVVEIEKNYFDEKILEEVENGNG